METNLRQNSDLNEEIKRLVNELKFANISLNVYK